MNPLDDPKINWIVSKASERLDVACELAAATHSATGWEVAFDTCGRTPAAEFRSAMDS